MDFLVLYITARTFKAVGVMTTPLCYAHVLFCQPVNNLKPNSPEETSKSFSRRKDHVFLEKSAPIDFPICNFNCDIFPSLCRNSII